MTGSLTGREKILANRHEFILQYYNMAVQDLDRHLKIGWQTIAVVAGAIASISLGEQGDLPLYVAVSAALVVLYWGLQNVVDANYWSLRAIAFLANVEAVYFSQSDRKHFNPYAGFHPPYKLLNSLRYQFNVCIILIVGIVGFFAYKLLVIGGGWSGLKSAFVDSNFPKIIAWQFPILITLYYIRSILLTWAERLLKYLDFVMSSPGPGMVSDIAYLRDADLLPSTEDSNFIDGDKIQSNRVTELRKREVCAKLIKKWNWWVFSISVFVLLLLDYYRACIIA